MDIRSILKGRKSNIGIQTFFFILMSILMIWIIYFGISKMFLGPH